MNTILQKITTIIDSYETGEWQSVDNLRVMLRELSACHYKLTTFNIQYAQQHNKEIYLFKGSDAAGQRHAELKVPELRITRKILTSVNIVLNAMRSEISIIKNE